MFTFHSPLLIYHFKSAIALFEYVVVLQPDADELFSKKLRFSPGDDASKLPQAICNFGEAVIASD